MTGKVPSLVVGTTLRSKRFHRTSILSLAYYEFSVKPLHLSPENRGFGSRLPVVFYVLCNMDSGPDPRNPCQPKINCRPLPP